MPATGECQHPARLSRLDALIRGYLDKATAFSGADSDWSVTTAEMPLRDGKGRNCSHMRVWEANIECEHLAQLSGTLRGQHLDSRHLDKAAAFLSSDWCAGTAQAAQMPLKDGHGRNRSVARICKVNFEWKHPARWHRRDPSIRGYLDKDLRFSGADRCVGAAQMPLKDGPRPLAEISAQRESDSWEATFECGHPARCSRSDPIIGGYLDKVFRFSGADRCVGTAQMPLKAGPSRNHCAARVRVSEKPHPNVGILLGAAGATPSLVDVSTKSYAFRARIGALEPCRCPWKLARAEIAAPRES